jgi:glycosyltransferase involved in cell wall biosynthesis
MKILVIGINYSPEPTGSAPYTAGLAEILAADGHTVVAYAGIPHYPWWKVLPEDKLRLRRHEFVNGVNVIHFRHYVPKKQSTLRRVVWELTFLANVSVKRTKTIPDLIFCSTPSLSGGLAGVYFARKYKIPLVTVVQDLVGKAVTQSGLSSGNLVGDIVSKIEKFILRNSSKVCIVSPKFRDYVISAPVDEKSLIRFPNWTHISQPTLNQEEARKYFGWGDEITIVLHTGNMGLKQDLTNVINAAKLFVPDEQIRFILCGDGNQKNFLVNSAKDVKILKFLPPVLEKDYANLLLAADILLVNEKDSVGDMSLPSKLTSYLASGTPIVAAVSSQGACALEVENTNGAAVVISANDPEKLAAAIRELNSNDVLKQNMASIGINYAHKYLSVDSAKSTLRAILNDLKNN